MTLTDPREALADESEFIGYLLGIAGLVRVIHTLAEDDQHSGPSSDRCDSDDFVHVLLGVASIGAGIERIANSVVPQDIAAGPPPPVAPTRRWLR